jgi:hypothetical protein
MLMVIAKRGHGSKVAGLTVVTLSHQSVAFCGLPMPSAKLTRKVRKGAKK